MGRGERSRGGARKGWAEGGPAAGGGDALTAGRRRVRGRRRVSWVAVWVVVVAAIAPPVAIATQQGPVGPTARMVAGPAGMRLLAPAAQVGCKTGRGPDVRVAVNWSRKALQRPVRSVRVLLQRPGSEAVIDSIVFAPARPTTTRRATLSASACRTNFDVRYELFVGAADRPHDHSSVVFRTHGRAVGSG